MVSLLVIVPILAAFALLFGVPPKISALVAAAANLVLAVLAALSYAAAKDQAQFDSSWWVLDPIAAYQTGNFQINFQFSLSDNSVIMMLLTALVTLAAVLSGKAPKQHFRLWYSSILLIAAGAMGAFLATDLFFFYAFHELALIPTFLMIGILGRGERKAIAWKATIYLATGSILLLAGIVWLANITGTFDIASLKTSLFSLLASTPDRAEITAQLHIIIGMMIVGYGTLVSLFPFHSWAAPAYASAPAPIAMLHSGVLKKFGLYGMIVTVVQVMPSPLLQAWVPLLLTLLLFNIIWVGLVTVNQKRIDQMLGNSSVMHMGYIFLALAAVMAVPSNEIAIPAALLLMFAHGISIAMSFSLADVIERKTGTLELNQLGGMAKTAPKICFYFGLVAMASLGLPGLANFAGEIMVFFSGFVGWQAGTSFGALQWATILALWGVVLSAVYMLRALKSIFHGGLADSTKGIEDISLADQVPALILGAVLLLVGIFPKIILNFLT